MVPDENDGSADVVQHHLPALARVGGEARAELHVEEVEDGVAEDDDPRHRHVEVQVPEAQGLRQDLELRRGVQHLDEAVEARHEAHGLHRPRGREQGLQAWSALEESAVDGLASSLTRLARVAEGGPCSLRVSRLLGGEAQLLEAVDLDLGVGLAHVDGPLLLRCPILGRRGSLECALLEEVLDAAGGGGCVSRGAFFRECTHACPDVRQRRDALLTRLAVLLCHRGEIGRLQAHVEPAAVFPALVQEGPPVLLRPCIRGAPEQLGKHRP
mmetsp:Transcript_4707/g.13118  ORF Transcript_4707/g.13118 Transcript_4707/m.13118 type:complete len:270 (+) Transcript_4707:2984-3793(+)